MSEHLNRQRTVLIVDDVEDNRVLLQRSLRSGGYRTVEAPDGRQALAIIQDSPPDIVLLDWMMPGLSGLETLKAIREFHDANHLPVIMCTALGEDENVVEALRSGANDYVVKPISLPVLRARIITQLAHSDSFADVDGKRQESKKRMAEQMRRLMEAQGKA